MYAVVIQIECDDEFSVRIFRLRVSLDSREPEANLLVNPFEEIFFGRFRHQSVDIS